MNNDTEWVEDVRRWCRSGGGGVSASQAAGADDEYLGYEAAQPAIEARHWGDTASPSAAFATSAAFTTGR